MSATHSSEPVTDAPRGYREGPDLDQLVAEIAAENPRPVRFIDVDRVRRGGVMGFFAKENFALTYEVTPGAGEVAGGVDLAALVGSADAADGVEKPKPARAKAKPAAKSKAPARASAVSSASKQEFADMLLALAEKTVDGPAAGTADAANPAPAVFELTTPAVEPARTPDFWNLAPPTETDHTEPTPGDDVIIDASLTTFSPATITLPPPARSITPEAPPVTAAEAADPAHVLRELGVPEGWGAGQDARAPIVAAIAIAVDALPKPPTVPTRPGDLTVLIVGDGVSVVDAARVFHDQYGMQLKTATTRAEALSAVAGLRAGERPGLLVVPAEEAGDRLAGMAVSARADLVVLAVPATGKPSDQRRLVRRLAEAGVAVDGLAVDHAARTSSPATVWELGLPVILLDGRPATVEQWIALLLSTC